MPTPPAHQGLPPQEPGVRLARALPYAFSVSGRIDAADGRYWLDFDNTGAAAAVLHIYSGDRPDGPWTYTVGTGATLSDYWSIVAVTHGLYDLSAYGPNGFLRTFGGDFNIATSGSSASPEVGTSYDAVGDNLVLHVDNAGAAACTVTLTPNNYSDAQPMSYALAAGASIDIAWPLAASAHWYDVTLTSDHDKRYVRRLAGHVETGQASTSDPAYGQSPERVFASGFD